MSQSRSAPGGIGSSPRVRGTLAAGRTRFPSWRFIPACAGNTPWRPASITPPPVRVHPRVCGEHSRFFDPGLGWDGSSPRVRGTLFAKTGFARYRRFIPACAGNTRRKIYPKSVCSVHPRVCGEHTTLCRECSVPPTVHPRVCGEHRPVAVVARCGNGSSPRVRGTRKQHADEPQLRRFIPACAGNTRSRRCASR